MRLPLRIKIWNLYPESKKLGVTATPWRMNHQSFTDLFDKLVISMPIKDFIKQGYLSPYVYYSLRDESYIQKAINGIALDKFGEYSEASMEEKMDIGKIRAQLLSSYQSLAKGKKGIIYAINRTHAAHIQKEYEGAGYNVVSIDSKTPDGERKAIVEEFKKRNSKIDIIVNVDIFSEGFDCPDIEFIQLARPTKSLVKYLQQVGRGLRITESKGTCIILDNVGMYSRFGLPDAHRHWNYHFLGHDVDEEPPRKGISKGSGRPRFVDMSEGTEDMELIQESDLVEEMPEKFVNKDKAITFLDWKGLLTVGGVTLGKTTWKEAEDLGYIVKIFDKGPSRVVNVNNTYFWDDKGEGVFTSLYRSKHNVKDQEMPSSWVANGFSWNKSYEEWIKVFQNMGFSIKVTEEPHVEEYPGMGKLKARFKALSSDGYLEFDLRFGDMAIQYYSDTRRTLGRIFADYKGRIDKENISSPTETSLSRLNENPIAHAFFPLWGITLGKTSWKDMEDLGNKVEIWEKGPSRTADSHGVDFWDHKGEGKFTSLHWGHFRADFPSSWKSNGFSWDNSYDEWIKTFIRLGYEVNIRKQPISRLYSGREVLEAECYFVSLDRKLEFRLHFGYGSNGHLKSSPKTLFTLDVEYIGIENDSKQYSSSDLDTNITKKQSHVNTESDSLSDNSLLSKEDTLKLKKIFDNKATSYKYFWFMSLIQIYKESELETIPYENMLAKMAANAWKYVFFEAGQFSSVDKLPHCLKVVNNWFKFDRNTNEETIYKRILGCMRSFDFYCILAPLLGEVPYRLLSPWIPYTSYQEVAEKSMLPDSRSLYRLNAGNIQVNDIWKNYLIDHYNELLFFTEISLKTYLKIYKTSSSYESFCKTKFNSLNQLVNAIQERKGLPDMRLFCIKFDLPLERKLTPSDILERVLEMNYTIDKNGKKQIDIREGQWSVKQLEKLFTKKFI